MGGGLAALMGLLGGGGKGLYEGFSAGIGDQQKAAEMALSQQKLAENQRQFNEGQFTPTSELPTELSGLVKPGTEKIRNTLLPTYEKTREDIQAQGIRKQQQDYFTQAAQDPNLDPDTRALMKMMAAPGFGPAQATMGTALSNMGRMTAHQATGVGPSGDSEVYSYATNRKGNVAVPPEPLGLRQAPSRQTFNRGDIERVLEEKGWAKETPGYAEAYANVARQIPVAGVGVYGAGQFVVPPPPGQGITPQAPVTPREGLPTRPLVSAEQPLPAGEATNLADFRTLLSQLDRVEKIYDPSVSGPVQGRLGALRTFTGIQSSEKEAELRSELASIQNSIIYLRSGKQINEGEFARFQAELPNINDPENVFRTKLARAKSLLQQMLQNREREFSSRQFRGESSPGAPRPPVTITPSAPSSLPSILNPLKPPAPTNPTSSPTSSSTWPEGKRLYSPSQGKWGVITNGIWVPE